jgi:hypothetical protein
MTKEWLASLQVGDSVEIYTMWENASHPSERGEMVSLSVVIAVEDGRIEVEGWGWFQQGSFGPHTHLRAPSGGIAA